MSKSPITCHVLDASIGKPAAGVRVSISSLGETLAEDESSCEAVLATGETDVDGRCSTLLAPGQQVSPGMYKMTFFTDPYFNAKGISSFYPLVEITFKYTNPEQHYHIPLLISPFSYTTYRGS